MEWKFWDGVNRKQQKKIEWKWKKLKIFDEENAKVIDNANQCKSVFVDKFRRQNPLSYVSAQKISYLKDDGRLVRFRNNSLVNTCLRRNS